MRGFVMQITSIIKTLIGLLGIAVGSLASSNSAKQLQLALNPEKTIVVKIEASRKIVVTQANHVLSTKIDPSLAKHLKLAEEINLIFSNPITQPKNQLFVVLVREPSKNPQGTGFCGAGLEDYLLLIEVSSEKISILDKLLLQSCLTSQELASDQGSNPLKAMRIDASKKSLTYRILGEEVEKTITIVDRKFQTN
jgi:hypothetical protein